MLGPTSARQTLARRLVREQTRGYSHKRNTTINASDIIVFPSTDSSPLRLALMDD
jgi:hypothetical protein